MDQPNAFKPLDLVSGAAIAALTDDPRLWNHFGLEIIRFAVSRRASTHFLMPYRRDIGLDAASALELGGPCAAASTLAAMYLLSGRRSPALLTLALDQRTTTTPDTVCPPSDSAGANEALTFYDAVRGDAARGTLGVFYWQCCLKIADETVALPHEPGANDPAMTDFLLGMQRRTGNQSYGVAARRAIRSSEQRYQVSRANCANLCALYLGLSLFWTQIPGIKAHWICTSPPAVGVSEGTDTPLPI
jgi:hypothetical protein